MKAKSELQIDRVALMQGEVTSASSQLHHLSGPGRLIGCGNDPHILQPFLDAADKAAGPLLGLGFLDRLGDIGGDLDDDLRMQRDAHRMQAEGLDRPVEDDLAPLDGEAGLLEVARLDIARGVLIVDVHNKDVFRFAHDAPIVASRRNRETFSREIVFFEITRVPAGRRAFNSALTFRDVETMTGVTLVLLSVGLVLAALLHGARWVLHEVATRHARTARAPSSPPQARVRPVKLLVTGVPAALTSS